VVVREGVNARHLTPADLPGPVDLVTVDVSFISLRRILPVVPPLLRPGGDVVALVKPQFEAGRMEVRKGVIRDPAIHAASPRRHHQTEPAIADQPHRLKIRWVARPAWTRSGHVGSNRLRLIPAGCRLLARDTLGRACQRSTLGLHAVNDNEARRSEAP
jgi:hypothetical protein